MSRRTARWLAWSVWVLCAALITLTWLFRLTTSYPRPDQGEPIWLYIVFAVLVLSYLTVGSLVASRRPDNPIGWIFCGAGLFFVSSFFGEAYVEHALYIGGGPVTGAGYLTWLSEQLALPVMALTMVLFLLLFPSGRLPSGLLFPERRVPSRSWWQAVVWMVVGGSALVGLWLISEPSVTEHPVHVGNPLAIGGTVGAAVEVGGKIGLLLLAISGLFAAALLISRLMVARGDERQQLKWFAYACVLLMCGFLVGALLGGWYSGLLVVWYGLGTLPIVTGIAILKHHLYDIDLVINRTLVYGSLTALLVLVYFGGVTATQAIFRALTGQEEQPQLAIVVSTLVIAALFNPLRRRVQSFIDRRFYRRKYDAAKTLEAFSAKLRDETDLEALNNELVGVVRETMQPAHVTLWLRPDKVSKGAQAD